ncbi:hypothetical protein EDC01DRAFT_729492 [Geopyxis carbonaria]|nr:hypothetical protein EDC01DRAFT_729492 [Geopyxis carbonaria]
MASKTTTGGADVKTTVKSVDMSEEMSQVAQETAKRTMQEHNVEKDIAQNIKKEVSIRSYVKITTIADWFNSLILNMELHVTELSVSPQDLLTKSMHRALYCRTKLWEFCDSRYLQSQQL